MPPKKKTVAPMDELYFAHYREYSAKYKSSQVAILLLAGKFYEMYDSIVDGKGITNVQAAAEACGCAAEPRPTGDPARLRIFLGFPEIALDKFERMLVAAGYTVVVFNQSKNEMGAVTSRPRDRISSPGTYLDTELETKREERFLIGICIEPYKDTIKSQTHWYGAATAFDVTTGQIRSTEFDLVLIDGKPITDTIQPFLSMFPPIEVVFTGLTLEKDLPSEKDVRTAFVPSGHRPPIHIRASLAAENTAAADRARLDFLQSVFKPRTALSLEHFLDIERYPFVRKSLAHLLTFIKEHNASFLTALPHHAMWSAESECLLGNAALQQLAMIPTHIEKEHESLLYWIQKAITSMGKRALRERCMKPIADIKVLEERQDRIQGLRGTSCRAALETELKGVCDLPRLYRRFQLGTAGTTELVQLLRSYERIERMLEIIGHEKENEIKTLQSHIRELLTTWDVERIRASEAVVGDRIAIGVTHPWRRGIRPRLDALEDRWSAVYAAMMSVKAGWNETLCESEAVTWTLKEEAPFTFTTTGRRGRMVASKDSTVSVEVRGSSTTVTLVSDAIRAANEEAGRIRAEWKTIAAELWSAEWTAWMNVNTENGILLEIVEFVGELDADCGLASAADQYGYVRPEYVLDSEESGVQVVAMRHPILERVHTSSRYVPHSLSFGCFHNDLDKKENTATTPGGLLLYGVNAAGKSSLGKALGLTVLMAQIGMPVPATSMRLVPYTRLFTRILGNDNLWLGMSSFVVEMTEFRQILKYADNQSLVLGDELCAGTETESAIALVSAGIQVLVKRGTHFFFATHLHELRDELELEQIRAYHLTVSVAGGALVYDRLLKEGSGSEMYGLEVCRGLDMDSEFLSMAFAIRKRRCEGTVKPSRYNAAVTVSACSVCGSSEGLETHHIVPQAAANESGRIDVGVSKNVVANLAVLCSSCHLKHHTGVLKIEGWKDTTEGRKLVC